MIAPIVLFVYNRPEHTLRTLEALSLNYLAQESMLFVYCDGPKKMATEEEKRKIKAVRHVVHAQKWCGSVQVIERETNWGLARSIKVGVTAIIQKTGKVIVLEDDLVTSPYFLEYMNQALNLYEGDKNVWHISGWTYPIDYRIAEDTFLWKTMNCWGWATWSDRWSHFDDDVDRWLRDFSEVDIKAFNVGGSENFWQQMVDNKNGSITTWAIFWYATIFKNNGLCLNPTRPFVQNIGIDGSGEHSRENDNWINSNMAAEKVQLSRISIKSNELATARVMSFFRKKNSLYNRVRQKIASVLAKLQYV